LYELAHYKTDYLSYSFTVTIFRKKYALIIDIAGPNDHLGGIGIGSPYQRKNGALSSNFSCFSFPSHRDGELAGILAQIIARITQCHTVVLMGIHFPEISKTKLNDLIKFLKNWVSEIGISLVNEISSSLCKEEHP
jgi:hypothetical protein